MDIGDTNIPGLYYIPNAFENWTTPLQNFLESDAKWHSIGTATNSRRVAHYGFAYEYKTGKAKGPTDPFPPIIVSLRDEIKALMWTTQSPSPNFCMVPYDMPLNQCIINEYTPGQGIGAHVDNESYDDWICCFTLGSGAVIEFTSVSNPAMKEYLYTEPGSMYFMSGEARWQWKHEQRPRKTDVVEGVKVSRNTRTSITYRTVKLDSEARED
jgi:alkylated DNA repair dioxygenase AlkB